MENKNPNPRPAQAGKYGDSAALADSRQAPTKKTPEGLLNDLGFEKVESDSVWKFVRDDAVIRVDIYEDPPSPRDDDGNVGIIALYPGCDYDFADERLDEVPDDAIVSLPIYAYVHGGIVLGFADNDFPDRQWDVGHIGFMYTTKERIDKEAGMKMTKAEIRKDFQGELDDLNACLAGNIYYYAIEKRSTRGGCRTSEVVETLGSYYDEDEALSEAAGAVRYFDKRRAAKKEWGKYHE